MSKNKKKGRKSGGGGGGGRNANGGDSPAHIAKQFHGKQQKREYNLYGHPADSHS